MSPREPTEGERARPSVPKEQAANDGALASAATLYAMAMEGAEAFASDVLVLLPNPSPANGPGGEDADALLAADAEFSALCDVRRAAWIAAIEADTTVVDEQTEAARAPSVEGDDDERT